MSEEKKDKKKLKLEEVKATEVAHAGSLDEVEDHYHAGNPADIPDGVAYCRVHRIALIDGHCPKCPPEAE